MNPDTARQRYLSRHIEPGLPPCPPVKKFWHNVLVIPAYREPASALEQFSKPDAISGRKLIILVLNRPDSDPDVDANRDMRNAVDALPAGEHGMLKHLSPDTDLYLYDLEAVAGATPSDQGVGLARKVGCDLAFKWKCAGAINSRWLCNTDADATLPADYFRKVEAINGPAAAASFPFRHQPGPHPDCNRATAFYELRLHHYILGLEYAGSPYAFHTLGSCFAVTFDAYAQVRGVPRRAGAEDFYLLNKLAKIQAVNRLTGSCLQLASRISTRVPFGTGPAVAKISGAARPAELRLYEHPFCFEALRALLQAAPELRTAAQHELPGLLVRQALNPAQAQAADKVLADMGLAAGLDHCQRQGNTPEQFMRQFHQWFDGFRTLKFIHGVRDAGWPDLSFSTLNADRPIFWPADTSAEPDELCAVITRAWGWQCVEPAQLSATSP